MSLQFYVYALASTFFAFWSHRPVQTWAVLVSLHLAYGAFVDDKASVAHLKDFAIWKPLTLVIGCAVGVWGAYVIRAPATIKTSYPLWYNAAMLALGAIFVGTGFVWQLAPQKWWNYFAICILVQLLVVFVSVVFVPHDRIWMTQQGGGVRVHISFVLLLVYLDLPFAIGQSLPDSDGIWHFYYVLMFMGATIIWFALINILNYDKPPKQIATMAYAPIPEPPVESTYV